MDKFGNSLMILVSSIILAMVGGVIVSDVWNWFVAPLGVMEITALHGMGLAVILSFQLHGVAAKLNQMDSMEGDMPKTMTLILTVGMSYLITWGFAAIVHALM